MAHGLGPAELQRLFEAHAPGIHRRSLALVGRDADAWDVVQEVFVRLLQAGAGFRGEARPTTYIYRVTTHVALNALRARAVREAPGARVEEAGVDALAQAECRQFLVRLSDVLDARALSIAALHYSDGLGQEEIANVMGLSRKTINREVVRIRGLAQSLGEPVQREQGS
jgi:RNA polymerase sigma-70 factor, ECF subfamily